MNEPVDGTRDQSPEDVQRLAPTPVFTAGDAVSGLSSWLLERRLGSGGFGEVWLARHAWNAKEKPRAVKFCTDPAARHRLVTHEKNVVLRVMKHAGEHANVVPLLDCNLDGDIPWLMYEFVEGGTLASVIKQWHELPMPQRLGHAVRTLHAIAGALGRFHQFNPPLVHRDMKPQNVLMAGSTPRITDFGIGGVAIPPNDGSTTGTLTANSLSLPSALHAAGTRIYAPPEQMLGSTPNPRDDVYALGIIAYQMVMADLTAAPGTDATLELRDLKVPGELVSLIVKSVSMNPERRPKDATEWETALAAILQELPQQPDATDTGSPSKPWLVPPPAPTEQTPEHTGAPIPHGPRTASEPTRRARVVPWVASVVVAVSCATVLYFAIPGSWSNSSVPTNPVEETKGNTPEPKGQPPQVGGAPKGAVPKPGETREVEIAAGVKMTFCWVPAGECQLGSPQTERDAALKTSNNPNDAEWLQAETEEARGKFKTSGFWISKYETTQAEWAAVTGSNPSHFDGKKGNAAKGTDTSRFPVENVSWDAIQKEDGFLTMANAHGGIQKAFGAAGTFALPHEDAWEYACRGGLENQRPFFFGTELNGTQANVDGNRPFGTPVRGQSWKQTTVVGSYAKDFPHPWGLCDMHGNVFEWCANLYDNKGDRMARVRGGSWINGGVYSRTAFRYGFPPSFADNHIGFRVCIRFD